MTISLVEHYETYGDTYFEHFYFHLLKEEHRQNFSYGKFKTSINYHLRDNLTYDPETKIATCNSLDIPLTVAHPISEIMIVPDNLEPIHELLCIVFRSVIMAEIMNMDLNTY